MSRPALVCDYPSALDWLMTQINYERTTSMPYETAAFKLDRMRRLLALLGDPHLGLRAIHIAGTKGKGSTAAMLAAVLGAAGMRTGLYTSPHLASIEERIAVGGEPVSQGDFASLAAQLQEAIARLPADAATGQPAEPTFFEITTAMAFLHFARQNVEAAVLEVGLGGRLDSTNVCRPSVSIITSISFDHTRQLGNTLAAIAAEKAGIIKAGVPVVSGVVNDEPREVIRQVARQLRAPLFERGEAFDFDDLGSRGNEEPAGQRLDYREPGANPAWTLKDVQVGLLGRHQAANAAVAIAAVRRLQQQGWPIGEAALRAGLAAVRWPARIEVVGKRPTVILDVAHNVASIGALLAVLRERFAGRRRLLIFASSKDKDTAGMLRLLLPEFDEVVLTRYIYNPRAAEPESLRELALTELALAELSPANNGRPQHIPVLHTAATPQAAWQLARQSAGPDDLVCITGSFFLAAELRPLVGATTLESCQRSPDHWSGCASDQLTTARSASD